MHFALLISIRLQALTIVSSLAFVKVANAPLRGRLHVITDAASRVSISVNDGVTVREWSFYDFAATQLVPQFGFKPGRTNELRITAYDRFHNVATAVNALVFVTDTLPVFLV